MKSVQLVLFVLCLGLALNSCSNHTPKKPNIVFILIDDLGWTDLGYTGSGYYDTPNIDRLAGQGMIFTNAYANAANCAPTRASLLSGQYTPRHGIFTVANPARGDAKDRRLIPIENAREISLDKITIAEALKPAGYVSAAIGKWHIGHTQTEQGFDYAVDRPELGYKRGHFNPDSTYLTDQLTEEAVHFITTNQDQPFLLYLAHHAVHTPIEAKPGVIAKYEDKAAEGCHSQAEYAAMIESVDESVGAIHKTLQELRLSENTILIFFSDNGGHGTYTCQQPLRGGKGMYYEGGIRVPMFAYWPGTIANGSESEIPVISTDFYPTFLELAGASQPTDYPLDGKSLWPLLNESETWEREALYWHFPAYLESYAGLRDASRDSTFRTRPVSVIRKGNWKLLQFHEEWSLDGGRENIAANNAVELYDLSTDLGEVNNLADSEIEKRDELLNQLISWQKAINAPIPTEANTEYVGE